MDYILYASDIEILNQFKSTEERKTFYKLSLKVSFDDKTLNERLSRLEKLGRIKSHNRNGKKVYSLSDSYQ